METVTTPCIVWTGPTNGHGYGRVSFGGPRYDGQGRRTGCKSVALHRWVFEQLDGPLAPGEIVMHRCDNRPCFRFDHLRRGTQLDNVRDCEMKGRGRRLHGSDHPNAKLDDERARAIFMAIGAGEAQRAVAARFGVSRNLVRLIACGKAWRHATEHSR